MNVPAPDWRIHFAPCGSFSGNDSDERTWNCRYCLAAVEAGHQDVSLTILPDHRALAQCHLEQCPFYQQAKTAGALYVPALDVTTTTTTGNIPTNYSPWATEDLPPGWAESLAISRRLSDAGQVQPQPISEERTVPEQREHPQQHHQQQRMVTPVAQRRVRRRSSGSTGKSILKLLETQEKYEKQASVAAPPASSTRGSRVPLGETVTAAPVSRREFNAVATELREMINQRDRTVTHLEGQVTSVAQESAAVARALQQQVDSLEALLNYQVRGLDMRYQSLWTAHCHLRDRLEHVLYSDPGHGVGARPPLSRDDALA
jgi:hypothetical protein